MHWDLFEYSVNIHKRAQKGGRKMLMEISAIWAVIFMVAVICLAAVTIGGDDNE